MCQQGAAEADWCRERDKIIRRQGYDAQRAGEGKKTTDIEFDSDNYHFNLGWDTAADGREPW
jgi:hypothetical protein